MTGNAWLLLPRKKLPPRLPHATAYDALDADDARLIEQLRNRGVTLNADCVCWTEQAGYRASAYGVVCENGTGNWVHGMRVAERRSRNADRRNSSWFNDDMLDYWRARWAEDDARMQMRRDQCPRAYAQWQRAQLEARVVDDQERVVMRREWDEWERRQAYLEAERKKREARWTAEERAWFEEEQAAKAAKLKAARQQREAAVAPQHAVKSLARLLHRTARHVNQRDPRHRRHSQEDAGAVEAA